MLGRAPWRRVQQAIHRAGICAGFLAQAHPVPVVPGAIDHLDYRHIKHVRRRRTAPRQAGRQVTTASQHESRHDFSKAHVCQTLYACAQVLARGRGARAFGRGSCPNQCRARISRFSPAASRDLSSRRAAPENFTGDAPHSGCIFTQSVENFKSSCSTYGEVYSGDENFCSGKSTLNTYVVIQLEYEPKAKHASNFSAFVTYGMLVKFDPEHMVFRVSH